MVRYEVLSHTADTGIAVHGATLAEVFENAAYGMFDLMFDLSAVPALDRRRVEASGGSTEDLLVGWLSELLVQAEIEDLAFSSFTVSELGNDRVAGWAEGSPAGEQELRGPPVKAVTYHDLEVVAGPAGWSARVIFDV